MPQRLLNFSFFPRFPFMTYFILETTETSIWCDSEGLYYLDPLLLVLPMTDTAHFISDKQTKLSIETRHILTVYTCIATSLSSLCDPTTIAILCGFSFSIQSKWQLFHSLSKSCFHRVN